MTVTRSAAAPARGALAKEQHCPPGNKRKNKTLVRLPQRRGTGCSDGAVPQSQRKGLFAGWVSLTIFLFARVLRLVTLRIR